MESKSIFGLRQQPDEKTDIDSTVRRCVVLLVVSLSVMFGSILLSAFLLFVASMTGMHYPGSLWLFAAVFLLSAVAVEVFVTALAFFLNDRQFLLGAREECDCAGILAVIGMCLCLAWPVSFVLCYVSRTIRRQAWDL